MTSKPLTSRSHTIPAMALGLALLVICSQITIPLGVIPITAQTLAVLLIGLVYPLPAAALITSLYLLGGLLGLPFFAGFVGGPQTALAPSFGFIIGFIPAAVLGAWLRQRFAAAWIDWAASLAMSAVIYLVGISYMYVLLYGWELQVAQITYVIQIAMLPFLIGDSIKAILAVILARRLR